MRSPARAHREHGNDGEPGRQQRDTAAGPAVRVGAVDPGADRGHGEHDHDSAQNVERRHWRRHAGLRHEPHRHRNGQHGSRRQQPEDPPPARSPGQPAPEQRADHGADGRQREAQPKRPALPVRSWITGRQQGDARRQHEPRPGSLQHAEHHEHRQARRQRGAGQRHGEQQAARGKDPPPTRHVAQAARHDQRRALAEKIGAQRILRDLRARAEQAGHIRQSQHERQKADLHAEHGQRDSREGAALASRDRIPSPPHSPGARRSTATRSCRVRRWCGHRPPGRRCPETGRGARRPRRRPRQRG